MKHLIFVLTAALSLNALSQAAAPTSEAKPRQKLDRAKLHQIQMKKFGGHVKDVRNQRGQVVIVNAQSAAKEEWMNEVQKLFADMTKLVVDIKEGSFNLSKPEVMGAVSLFVVDDPALPMSLIAPESRWAMINVSPLKTEKEAFFAARVKKEMTRGMAYLLGAADSQYPMCLTGCVTKPEDLDQYPAVKLPMDLVGKFSKYPAGYGLTPYKMTTYKNAVMEGWAAQPTNEYQQAIWNEINATPTNPITIKPGDKPAK